MSTRFDTRKIERGIRLVLEGLRVDPKDRNYKDTPRRVAQMYAELFTPPKNNFKIFTEDHTNMIILRGHNVHGVCPHHLIPVAMRVSLAYVPNGRVLGLSKLARCVESQLTKPVLQETFTDAIVNDLYARVRPLGVACVVVGQHGCMQHRGVRTTGDIVTSAVRGVFSNQSAKEEFLRILGRI